ncbi:MAG: isoleucine--tRNA ligase [Alphaproteobacteria bacterium]|nr:isoleucine--tRNA ligase [Alphaproteobacteria bacterium]
MIVAKGKQPTQKSGTTENDRYKNTVFLPKTDFPLRAGLAEKEEKIVARWQEIDLYRLLRQDRAGKKRFVLHDGPPYANGHLHVGHAVNKILKDVITRARQIQGYDSNYVPGWDCHGLPIEWKVEEEFRAKGRKKSDVDVLEFRRACRAFAEHWITIQKGEFQRFGVIGDWNKPYKTMDFAAEAQIFREFTKFVENGGLYAGFRPVLWSVLEETALADAEVEYEEHVSQAIYVKFPVKTPSRPSLTQAAVVIWTTTPWTMPGNRAVAYQRDSHYCVIEALADSANKAIKIGDHLVVAADLVEKFANVMGVAFKTIAQLHGSELAGTILAHPLAGIAEAKGGYDFAVPLLPGAHVTAEAGTGLVHTAPGHGIDDFAVGKEFGLDVPVTVLSDGKFADSVPLMAGVHVFKADPIICDYLVSQHNLLHRTDFKHSYPHSWRSKSPLIYRATPQWFISMEANNLRQKALDAIDNTAWFPKTASNRIRSMIEQRPDWCISRQRVWGVPIAVFIDKGTSEILRDTAVNNRIAEAFTAEGGDAWFAAGSAARFLGKDYDPAKYDQIKDVVEVWFDSGTTHAFVLEQRDDLKNAEKIMYLEGTDQHRGWFHSSLLESCGTRGKAPYTEVLTHGFALDQQGRKMSKSLGNVVAPQDVAKTYGIDILRLWVVSTDYTEDVRIGPDILAHQADLYKRLRLTLRYLLGGLADWDESENIAYADLPDLEKYVLSLLAERDQQAKIWLELYDFHAIYAALHVFCNNELSAFYFNIRKDALYCDGADSLRRRACRTVMKIIYEWLVRWLSIVLCFTAEEAWAARPWNKTHDPADSVHRLTLLDCDAAWLRPDLAEAWQGITDLIDTTNVSIESMRSAKMIGSSLQLQLKLADDPASAALRLLKKLDASERANIFGVSQVELIRVDTDGDDDGAPFATLTSASGKKCPRCWQFAPEVGEPNPKKHHVPLCFRCDKVLPQ